MRGRLLAKIVLVSAIAGCGAGCEPEKRPLEIDHYRSPCYGEAHFLCMRVRSPGAEHWELFYDSIEGYTHRWGTVSTIELTVHQVANPPQDGSSATYKLSKVLSTRQVAPGTEVRIAVDGSLEARGYRSTATPEGTGGHLLDGTAFTCPDPAPCDQLRAALAQQRTVTARFAYADPVEAPLRLLAVE